MKHTVFAAVIWLLSVNMLQAQEHRVISELRETPSLQGVNVLKVHKE